MWLFFFAIYGMYHSSVGVEIIILRKEITMNDSRSNISLKVFIAALIYFVLTPAAFADDFALGQVVSPGGPSLNGQIHEINLTTLDTRLITTIPGTVTGNQPNAHAWDDVNKRFYYADALGGQMFVWTQTNGGTPDDDHFSLGLVCAEGYTGVCNSAVPGGIPAIASAAFYNDRYYFIVENTDDLWEVEFTATGVAPFIEIATAGVNKIGDITGNDHVWGFGDIAFDASGLLFGIAKRWDNNQIEFFSYDVAGAGSYVTIRSEAATPPTYALAQLTFNTAGVLYACFAGTGECFTVALANGIFTSIGTASVGFRDLGGPGPGPTAANRKAWREVID